MLIETLGLTKVYGKFTALADCSLAISPGEVFGLLGPNGAGKTTLLRLVLGFLRPTSGSAIVDGFDCERQSLEVRRRVAYLPGEARLFRSMRGRDAIRLLSQLRPHSVVQQRRAVAIAERLELDLLRRVALMSTGMRQKLALAITLSAETSIVILDEPTANLDPTVRRTVLNLVREAKAAGRTVVFSSHVLAESEEVCDRVAVLRGGRLVHVQSIHDLRRQHRIYLQTTAPIAPPAHLAVDVRHPFSADGWSILETTSELQPLLGWLATLPLAEVRIEPLGLRAIYETYHPSTDEIEPGDLADREERKHA